MNLTSLKLPTTILSVENGGKTIVRKTAGDARNTDGIKYCFVSITVL